VNRIVAVSNRVADPRHRASTGGLAVGLLSALEKGGGVWFGWNGELTEGHTHEPQVHVRQGVKFVTIDLNNLEFEQYYNGFCNNTLWPLFHYRLGLFEYRRAQFESYLRVNDLFASKLVPLLEPDDLLWVHDFHLIPLARLLRSAGVTRPIGLFLHTPFPSFEVLRALPVYRQLLEDMCAFDVLGFQTDRDLDAFRDCVTRPEIGAERLADGALRFDGRTMEARTFPIGIDVASSAERAAAQADSRQVQGIRASLDGRQLLFGVDRLDYSKGLVKRFESYETFLERFPEFRREVVYIQIAAPTRAGIRAYAEIRRELERVSGHINGRFAEVDWVPLRYLNRAVDRGALMAMLRLARIGLVTPVRDGMNLVAKEYVAAQDPADPGVLVLSMMTGAAEELKDAVLVNPHDCDAVAEGILLGLRMPLEERRNRHAAMLEVLRRNDITAWRERFVAALQGVARSGVN
jgi:trehalose 6-phosphate synthase